MRKGISVIGIVVQCVWLASCTQTITFKEPYHLTAIQKKFRAKLDNTLTTLTYESSDLGAHGVYDVGRALTYVIENDPKADVSLGYVASSSDYTLTPSYGFGPAAVANYHLTLLVQANGQRQVMEVVGHGETYWNTYNAYQEAIERAVISLHQKLTALFSAARAAQDP
jgi:hypothetical protein